MTEDVETNATVLVVESELSVRTDVTACLIKAGFAVIEAEDPEEAWTTLESRPEVGVLLADVDLISGTDGLDLARRAHNRWPSLGLVITSYHVRHLHPADVPGNGCFLPRPVPLDVLLQEVGAAARP